MTLIVGKCFVFDARLNARAEGVTDIALVVLPEAAIPPKEEIEDTKLGERVADEVIAALSQRQPSPPEMRTEEMEEVLPFGGNDFTEAVENMEKHFLQHRWSDGFPLVPPTEEAVNRMLEGTELPGDHVVGSVEPGGGEATIKKIAINAVMAGCLPQYMPVIIAAVEAITDPVSFDLRGLQCTTGLTSPLLVISGPKLIEQLNINDSYSAIGPGWRANTIGRTVRLLMINIGHAWPGEPDMKSFGSPFKFVTLVAENERGYAGAWEPIRVAEGFDYDQATVSIMPAITWQIDFLRPELASSDKIVELLAMQGRVKFDRFAVNWGMDNLVIIGPTTFEPIRKEGRSRIDIQKALYEQIQAPCFEFFHNLEPSTEAGYTPIPEWLVKKCKADPKALAPLLLKPESIKIIVAGAPGPAHLAYVSPWGSGNAYFVTKSIKLPKNWDRLLDRYKGWETPIVR